MGKERKRCRRVRGKGNGRDGGSERWKEQDRKSKGLDTEMQRREKRKIEKEQRLNREEMRKNKVYSKEMSEEVSGKINSGGEKKKKESVRLSTTYDDITPRPVVVCCLRAELWNRVSHPQRRFTPRKSQHEELCC